MEEQKSESGDGLPPGCAGDFSVRSSGKRDKPPVTKGPKSTDSRTNGTVTRNRRSNTIKDEMTMDSSSGTEGTLPSCSTAADTADLEQKEKDDPTNSDDSVHAVQESEVENRGSKRKQHGTKESNNKKRPNLPRRASKRIAGIEVGPLPELKSDDRTRRVSARRLNKKEAGNSIERAEKTSTTGILVGVEVGLLPELKPENQTHRVSSRNSEEAGSAVSSEECSEKTSKISTDGKTADVLPPENPPSNSLNDHALLVEKQESSLDISLKDLWTDPCIEFAIKTLTGVIPIDEEDNDATQDDSGKSKMVEDNPMEDGKTENNSYEFSFKDVWEDPCIEFAIKTLTGAIPVVDDFVVDEQHLTSSSSEMSNKGSNMFGVSNGSFQSSNVLLQQFDRSTEQPYDHHRALGASASPHIGNGGSLQRSGDGVLHPHCEDMSKEVQRRTTCR